MHKMKLIIAKYCCIISLILFFNSASAQDLNSDLTNEIAVIRSGKNILVDVQKLLKYNHQTLLDSLVSFKKDTSATVRFNVNLLEYKIALSNPQDTAIVHEVVFRLIQSLADTDNRVRQSSAKKLITFSESDFDKRSVHLLSKNLKKYTDSKELFLIIGLANVQELKKYMLSKVNYNPATTLSDFNSPNWGMQMALARMGNPESINYCVSNIDGYNEAIPKYTLLLKDLAYTRSRSAVALLRKYLDNTTRMPSVSAGVEGAPYCHYALDILIAMLEDFPVKSTGLGYSQADIDAARVWIDSHSDYKIKQ
jgi:hypothetical protein